MSMGRPKLPEDQRRVLHSMTFTPKFSEWIKSYAKAQGIGQGAVLEIIVRQGRTFKTTKPKSS